MIKLRSILITALAISVICGCRSDSSVNTDFRLDCSKSSYLEFDGQRPPRGGICGQARFFDHGALFIPTAGISCGGMIGCFPGATTPALPPERYFCKTINIPRGAETFSYCSTSGTVICFAINQRNPQFERNKPQFRDEDGFNKFTEYFGYNIGLKANKSFFFFDAMVIAVGTSISCEESDFEIVTTLFQNKLKKQNIDSFSCSDPKAMSLFPVDFSSDKTTIIVDSRKTGYYIPEGNHLKVIRKTLAGSQAVPGNSASFARSTSQTEIAYIDHGDDPDDASYEYYIMPDSSLRKMIDFADIQESPEPDFKVLARTKAAHVVSNCRTGIIAYAVFAPASKLPGEIYEVSGKAVVLSGSTNGTNWLKMKWIDKDAVSIAIRGKIEVLAPSSGASETRLESRSDGTYLTVIKSNAKNRQLMLRYRPDPPPAPYHKH